MAEGGFAVLEKVFADRHIVSLSSLLKDDETRQSLPQPFRAAVAVQVRSQCEPQRSNVGQLLLDWYELTESCDSVLFMKGLKDKWHLPCVVTTRQGCECPFIPHAARSDWEGLHAVLGTNKMRWLLTHCSLYVLIGQRAWLQISGPLNKGDLEKAFPFTFRGGSARGAVKRKRKDDAGNATIQAKRSTPILASVQRPLKKIRLRSSDGSIQQRTLQQAIDNRMDQKVSTMSLVPRLKKIRIHRRDSNQLAIMPSVSDHRLDVAKSTNNINNKRRRRRRNKFKQIVDNRRAIDGSTPIPHDEILYSSSGWTHFPITHPLFRSTPDETIAAILNTSVGTECLTDQPELIRFTELVTVMGKNHRQCRYNAILRRMLSAYDPKKASVDADRVYQFIKCVVKKVVPVELLGGPANRRTFLSNVRYFVNAGRGTVFTLSELIQSMRTGRCRWLAHLSSLPVQISLLARVTAWLFLDFVKPLIRQHFYATETAHGRNRIFFYSKDVWQRIHHRMMRSICSVSLRHPLAVLSAASPDNDVISELENLLLRGRLRFVPKKEGSRPIMSTAFRRVGRKEVGLVRLLLHAITGFYKEGMDAKSTHSLHRKWVVHFLKRRPNAPIYYVHADVEDAFGSIHHDKMVDILRWYQTQLPRELVVRTLAHVTPDGRRSRNFQIVPYFCSIDPNEWVQRLAPGTVVFDVGARSERFDTAKLLDFAIQSVREVHVVHNDKAHYRLTRGIPQGSRLSSALCHIYYGHMVREHLSEFLNHPDDLLVRVVDDFLYLTESGQRARAFHHRVHQGFPDYNAYVNPTKSATNLVLDDITGQAPPLRKPLWSSFCGLQFNTRTMEIRGDYTKYEATDVIHCITPSAGQPGKLLLKRLQGISTLKIEVFIFIFRV